MKLIYEAISWIEQNHKNSSPFFNQKDKAMSIIRRYIMWLWINEIELDFSSEKRKKYLEECYIQAEGDILAGILNLDIEQEDKARLIYFLYLSDEEKQELIESIEEAKEEVKRIYHEEKVNYHNNEKNILEQLKNPKYMNQLVNLRFQSEVKVIPYVSLIDKDSMKLHYQQNRGVLLIIGHEYNIKNDIFMYSHKSSLEKFKALGDDTRLKIVESIIEEPKTASELSSLLNLTIPTIAHHLKVLVLAGIISTCVNTEETAKVTYELYYPGIENLIANLNKLMLGGIR